MSGGHFDYQQFRLEDIATEIKELIKSNDDETPNEWGYGTKGAGYSPETIAEFKKAVVLLGKAQIYAHRIDWMVSGDDGEDDFHERLKEDLALFKYHAFLDLGVDDEEEDDD